MAFLRSGCVTILFCAGVSAAVAAERIRTAAQVPETQPPAAAPASPIILSSPPAEGSFALPADRVETPAAPAAAQAPAAARPAIAAPAQAAAPATALKKPPAPLQFATVSTDPRPTLDPGTFVNTMRAAERYHAIASAGGWGTLPKGTTLKLGDKGQLVVRLKERLAATNDLARDSLAGEAFDPAVLASVKRFQGRHGLSETGVVGPRTIEALNVPAEVRARQLSGSAQRLAGTRFPFGERYVVVNIPAATVEAVEKGQVARRYVAVVGKRERPSPTVMAHVQSINFNPTWTVPVSIIKKDVIPHMRKDAGYLARMKIRILDGHGRELDPATIDWATEKAADYTLRQDAGTANSLGQIRIDMPNRHAVYMHDTPTKRLFAQGARFHSSGCVRVADVRDFAEWLLRGTPGPSGAWSKAEIDAGIATGARQDIKLAKPIPVAWVYLTGYAMPDGSVHFREDVYGLDVEKTLPPAAAEPVDPATTSSLPRKR